MEIQMGERIMRKSSFRRLFTAVFLVAACCVGSSLYAADTMLGVCFRDTTNTTYITTINALQKRCDELGITMRVADARENLATQISQIENFKAMGCKYIFVNVFDAVGIKDTIDQAVEEGFFIIIHDATIESASLTIGMDNYKFGYSVGKCAADYINSVPELKNADRVEWGLQTYTTVVDIIERSDAIKKAMEELAPNAVLVASKDVYSVEQGVEATENFVQANPNLKIVCGVTDPFVFGAYQAFTAEGFTGKEYGVFACDGADVALDLISKDTIYRGTVSLTLANTATEVVNIIQKHSEGQEVPKVIDYGMEIVTKENIGKYWPTK